MEYVYDKVSMWAWNHPEIKVWDDYFREINLFDKNFVEQYLDNMKNMVDDSYSMSFKTP